MSDDTPLAITPRKRRIGGGPLVAVAMPLLLVGYVLSVAPVARLAIDDRIEVSTWQNVYRPLLWVVDRSEIGARAFNWYCQLWRVRASYPWHRGGRYKVPPK